MRKFDCIWRGCEATIEGDDLDALTLQVRAHVDEAHNFKLTEANVRDYFEAEERLSPVRPRLEAIGDIEVSPATPERLDDVLHFFDYEAFAGKPDWAACYCMSHHVGEDGPDWCRARNRALLADRIADGTTTGFVAYAGGQVAAWCNASRRSEFVDFAGRDEHPDDEVGSIACFVVAPPYRRHGLSRKLLDAALGSFASRGLWLAEAYPNANPRDDSNAYHGALSMYIEAGFEAVGKLEHFDHLTVVQKPL